jgi:hypothetical protein
MGTLDALDRFYTPTWAVDALLKRLALPARSRILEPCAGQELRIAKVLERAGHTVVTNDLDDAAPTDFHLDFPGVVERWPERVRMMTEGQDGLDWIITNPPYTTASCTAASFVEACLKVCPRVAVLLRVSWLEVCADRERLLAEQPPARIITLPRVRFDGPAIAAKKGSKEGRTSSPGGNAWFLWWHDAPPDLPLISVVPKSEEVRRAEEERNFAPDRPVQGGLWT